MCHNDLSKIKYFCFLDHKEGDVREPLIQLGPEGPIRDNTPSFFEAIITGSRQSKAPESKGAPFLGDDEGAECEQGGAREHDADAAVLRQHFSGISQDPHSESSADETEEQQADGGVKTAHLSGQTKTPAKARIPKSQQPSPPVETGMMANEHGRRYWSTETIGQPMSKHHDAPAIPRARAHIQAREEAAQKAIEAAEAAQEALEAAAAAQEALEAAVRAEQLPQETQLAGR